MSEYNVRKSIGEKSIKYRFINRKKGNHSRSVHQYGKINKARGMRRKADRTSHHRRRGNVRSQLAHGNVDGVESLPRPSSSKMSGNTMGWSNQISNRQLLPTINVKIIL